MLFHKFHVNFINSINLLENCYNQKFPPVQDAQSQALLVKNVSQIALFGIQWSYNSQGKRVPVYIKSCVNPDTAILHFHSDPTIQIAACGASK